MTDSLNIQNDLKQNQQDQMFFQPMTTCINPLKQQEDNNSSKQVFNILQPCSISKNNIINNNLSYSPNKFRELNCKKTNKQAKRCHTENSVNDENAYKTQIEQDIKENIIYSSNKLRVGLSQSQIESTKVESLNESIYRYNDQSEDQSEALLEKDEEIQMLKAKRMADSIEIQYLKSIIQGVQNNLDSVSIIDQGENFVFYNIPSYFENQEDNQMQENISELYVDSVICRMIEKNCYDLSIQDLYSDIQKIKEDNSKEMFFQEKRIFQLESLIQIEQMHHRTYENEKKNLITKIAEMEIKQENLLSQQKQYQELIQKFKQEMGRLQEKLEFREYELNQLKEKKNVYQAKLKDCQDLNQEFKQRLEYKEKQLDDKDKQLEDLKEQISEPLENINMVFSIVSNYKQTLAQFDEKISELIQKQKTIDKLERQLGEKNEQMMMLVKMSNQMQEKINLLINENTQQAIYIHSINQKLQEQQLENEKLIEAQMQKQLELKQQENDNTPTNDIESTQTHQENQDKTPLIDNQCINNQSEIEDNRDYLIENDTFEDN
ncbi:hypothetical protein TTHERM_00152120 (macronuclear) [Tetrahymena thermophila SB210]|uniref:Uncharacterized protein n=1 Tax=Tetrahymena thermophila (strain SB210) TaxID=312017 RepID=I7MGJ5_TETTS|nr:hypothetical protein TTHERM_00152120 [Tetrahymena thermophila SB210]EAS01498.2 hypothetical protein TTHERM_00152120 [Tetrahymena thermophila SB210]|eukprot:XP_001021744.2 hypothetical protein TTHERM_00152120 [Tetrahymena thermophila SB210]